MSRLPMYGVLPHHRVKGVSDLNAVKEAHPVMLATFQEAFANNWPTDAHFLTYSPTGVDRGHLFPRCNKPVLQKLRAQGIDLVRHTFAIDWDTPEHLPWGETFDKEQFFDLFVRAAERFPLASNYSCFYFTRKGARIVYVLDTPIPVDESEARLRWFIYNLRGAGLMVDELVDWTRLFRLPMVLRDGKPSESDESFDIEWDEDARLSVEDLGTTSMGEKARAYAEVKEFNYERPDEDDASALVEFLDNGKHQLTRWAKIAKRRLQGRECYQCIFSHHLIATEGSRDQTIIKYVGQAVSLLYHIEGTTPAHIYGLFLGPVLQLEEKPGEDWLGVLWSAIGRMWSKEEAKATADKRLKQSSELRTAEQKNDILAGMREWCDVPELHSDDGEAMLWAERNFIVSSGQTYYLIGEDGYYREQPYSLTQLIAAIRTHIPDLIPTMVPTSDGSGVREVQVTSLLGRYMTVVNGVTVEPGITRGKIENINKPDARLVIPGFRLNFDLMPEFDSDVDEWLKKLFGEKADDACRWIAYALAFDEGATCAISIKGGQGAGKKMFVRGLAECLRHPTVATDVDITGGYQYGLLRSPFLVVNEGWSVGSAGKHPADRFRELTSGDVIEVSRKYRDPIEVKNPVRIIFTANNLDVIKMLAHKRDLSQADRDALAIRLMHFDVGGYASEWLRAKGGMKFTGSEGRRWVAPDSGGSSDFVVAKHFLWLYNNRHELWTPDKRLLVEGRGSDELMFEMQTQVGSSTLVIETLLQMLDYKVAQDGLVVVGDEVYVLTSAILHYWRDRMASKIRGENLTVNSIAKVLGGLCISDDGEEREPYTITGHESQGRRRWHQLDVWKIKKAADRHGFRCKRLDRITSFLKTEPTHAEPDSKD